MSPRNVHKYSIRTQPQQTSCKLWATWRYDKYASVNIILVTGRVHFRLYWPLYPFLSLFVRSYSWTVEITNDWISIISDYNIRGSTSRWNQYAIYTTHGQQKCIPYTFKISFKTIYMMTSWTNLCRQLDVIYHNIIQVLKCMFAVNCTHRWATSLILIYSFTLHHALSLLVSFSIHKTSASHFVHRSFEKSARYIPDSKYH